MAPTADSPLSSSATGLGLTSEQLEFWDTNGYLVIEDALTPETTTSLLNETKQMLNDFSLDDHPMTRFSTGEGENKHVGDDYFLNSGDQVRFFFEEGRCIQAFSSSQIIQSSSSQALMLTAPLQMPLTQQPVN